MYTLWSTAPHMIQMLHEIFPLLSHTITKHRRTPWHQDSGRLTTTVDINTLEHCNNIIIRNKTADASKLSQCLIKVFGQLMSDFPSSNCRGKDCHLPLFSANSILLLILLLLLYYISMTMVNKYLSCQHSRHYAEEEPWSLDQQCSLTTTKKTQQTTIVVSWCSCQQLHTTCAVMFSCVCWSWLLRKHVFKLKKETDPSSTSEILWLQ